MIGLDTNILVRYLTRDDEQQWQQSVTVIQQSQPCFITNIVLCELVWVLKGTNYGFRKDEIISVLETMLHSAAFEFEDRSTVDQALQRYKQGKADFSDYLIGAVSRQAGCTETISFDGKLKGEKGFSVWRASPANTAWQRTDESYWCGYQSRLPPLHFTVSIPRAGVPRIE